MGLNGRKRVLEEFTWDEIAKKTIQVYNELLEPEKPKKD
jgi:glycosyltransferase involved in cell wall biosynthesis